ncbi:MULTISPECIES: hypothetical protein [Bradyrhizobium]|uniref:hypothetical protein n=1 Tax=Bradyrhizobium TaxID=374 RepID=UPI00100902C4|nr:MULTISPECIES: hypothetical protein [Bradyrhizobium]
MTGKTFKQQVIGTILIVLLLSLLSLAASCWGNPNASDPYSSALRVVPAVLIPIGAAWLAFCVQRRVAFTKALFDVWQKIVVTVQDSIQYTHSPTHTQAEYAKVMHSLSCRIDDVRGAFRNVGEERTALSHETRKFVLAIQHAKSLSACASALATYGFPEKKSIGLYPFESLKQISAVISRLGYGSSITSQDSEIARDTILALWGILRGELLKELDRDYPDYPDTPFKA